MKIPTWLRRRLGPSRATLHRDIATTESSMIRAAKEI